MGVVRKALQAMFPRDKWHILRGDSVKILAGKDKGQQGVVTKVIRDPKQPRVLVEGLNLVRAPPPPFNPNLLHVQVVPREFLNL